MRQGNLRTQEQAEIQDWLKQLQYLDVTRKEFDRHQKQLSKQFGQKPAVNDTVWRILNSRVASTRDHHILLQVYSEMARLVEKEGKDPKPYYAKVSRHELLEIKEGGLYEKVRVQTCNDDHVCSACRELAKRTFTIEEALATLPVPNGCQSETGCRCFYEPVSPFEFDD